MTSAWTGGYVADTGYIQGYYHHQSPTHMAIACLLRGVACEIPRPDQDIHYLELGCGYGFGALVIAASNPLWRVTAIDFNPTHVAAGRAAAAEAGIENFTFLEADLATLWEDPLAQNIPQADFVSLHGVWSWITSSVRAGIVRLLRDKVRPGGVVHLSYNSLPGWQSGLAMLRVVQEVGRRCAGSSGKQAIAGLELVRNLADAQARQLTTPFAAALLERFKTTSPEYLAHEFMSLGTYPCFHGDVVRDLADAKLEWVAAGQLMENFRDLTLSAEQLAIADRFDDPILWELVKDTCISRGFRHDIFVRGAQRLDLATRDRIIGDIKILLLNQPEEFKFEIEIPAGKATLAQDLYTRIVTTLAEGPLPVSALDALRTPGDAPNPAELLGVLLGTDQALVVADADAAPAEGARRLNHVMVRRHVRLDRLAQPMAAACPPLSGGLPCSGIALFVLDQVAAGIDDPDVMATTLGPGLGDSDRTRLRDGIAEVIGTRRTFWRRLGMV